MRKKISIVIPTFNEEPNVKALYQAIRQCFNGDLPEDDYEILFIDNDSQDGTRAIIESLCMEDRSVKAIFNARNFGQFNSPYYGLCQVTGDCAILVCADFQDPIDLIPVFVKEWKAGNKIVIGIKTSSMENRAMFALRSLYYKILRRFSDVDQIEHFTGFGLYDKAFLDVLRNIDDSLPFLRGLVAELGFHRKEIPYQQAKRRAGKTSNNWYKLYDAGMLGITSYTKIGPRIASIAGLSVSFLSFCVGLIYLILKLVYWDRFAAGTAPILIGMFFLGSIQIFFIGVLGEYIMTINSRVQKRPLVVEERRLNFAVDSKNE